MRHLKTYLVLGLLLSVSLAACTITTSDGDGFGGESGFNWGGESGSSNGGSGTKSSSAKGGTGASVGGSSSSGGASVIASSSASGGSAAAGGSSSTTSAPPAYTKEQCAKDAAGTAETDPCASCVYGKQCDAAVICENTTGCMNSVWSALYCMASTSAWQAIMLDEDPATGHPTMEDTDNCTSGVLTESNLDQHYAEWNQHESQGLSTLADDWVGAELGSEALSLWSGLADTSTELGCRTVCHLDEVNP